MKRTEVMLSVVWLLAALVALPIAGCTVEERPKPTDELPNFDIDGNGTVDDLDGDLDGDGLSNRKELEIGTNPLLVDSDGDKYDDFYEFSTNPRIDPSRPFHPMIADVPQIRVEILKRPAFYLTTTQGQSSSESITITEGEDINREESTSYGDSRSYGNEANFSATFGFSQSVEVGTDFGGSWGASTEFTAGYTHTTDETYTSDSSVTESISTSLEESRETARETSREISGAHIVGALRLYNAGNIAVNVENLNAAYAHLNSNGKITEARSMEYEGAYAGGTLNFTLPPGENSSPISFYLDIEGADAAFSVAQDMVRAGSLQIMVQSMLLTNETAGNFTDVYTNVKNRSARVMIDPGPTFKVGGHNAILDKHVVATPKLDVAAVGAPGVTDPYVDTTLADLLHLLGVDYTAAERQIDGEARFGITALNGTAENLEADSFWLVALETQRLGVSGTIYFTPLGSYDPSQISVLPGETVQFIYSADKDKDGVPARIEMAAGSSDDSADSDNDGVPDQLEIFGWCKVAGAPVLGQVDADGRPTGACEEAGQQVLFTKPNQADTDGDLLNDLEDDRPLERPRFAVAGVNLISVIHNRGAGEPAAPAAGQEPTPPAFTLTFNANHLAASPPVGVDGVYSGGSVSTTEPGLESVIREEHLQWVVETTQRAEAAYLTRPQGGTRIALLRDDANDLRFATDFEEIAIEVGLGQVWTVEILSEEAATECGDTGTYNTNCDYEVYKVTLDSAPGFPRTYFAAALNSEQSDGWETNHYQGDTNRYLRTLRSGGDGWNVSPRFTGATDGRIEAAFFVMCETTEQLQALDQQAFGAPVANITSWTAASGSLLDGVAGCQWAYHQNPAVAPTDNAYDWQWPTDDQHVHFASKRRRTYQTKLYTVASGLDGNYVTSAITRTFKSVDPPWMKIVASIYRINWIEAKRWCAGSGSWCENEDNVRFRVKLEGRAGDTTSDFSEINWWGRGDQEVTRTVTDNHTPSDQMDPGDVMATIFDDDDNHWIDAYFPECDITPTLTPNEWRGTFQELGAHDDFKGTTTRTLIARGEDRSCVTDWNFKVDIQIRVTWESLN